MIHIFCDYMQAGIVPEGLNVGGLSNFRGNAIESKWLSTTGPFITSDIPIEDKLPQSLSFGFLESVDKCKDLSEWENPKTIYGGMLSEDGTSGSTELCGAGFPLCGNQRFEGHFYLESKRQLSTLYLRHASRDSPHPSYRPLLRRIG